MSARQEAANVLRRIVAALPLAPQLAAYLRGHADGLEARRKRSSS